MPPLFKKLNLKDHAEMLVLNAPASFEPELQALDGVKIARSLAEVSSIGFALAFAIRQTQVDALSADLVARSLADPVLWFAYPKGTSKRFTCDFNRDSGWAALRSFGFDTVRQVAIDEDWSALRFRRNEFIGG
jgi:hypothetical protein